MSESKYMTLDDMANIIREGSDVKVIDAKTKEDVTSFILTQIILEQAKNKNILLPVPFLHFILRNGDNLLPQYLENNFKQFIRGFDIFTR
jgi:polyhydroxyalkanoate synthesis repressor PhaR